MLKNLRQLVLHCTLGIILILAGVQPMQAAANLAMTAMDGPCCPDDCLPTPDCAPACAAMMQCHAGTFSLRGAACVLTESVIASAMRFAVVDMASSPGIAEEALRRPPKL